MNIAHSFIDLFFNHLYVLVNRLSNKYYFFDIIFIFMEDVMFEVTSTAVENLKSYLAQNNIDSAVRIALMQGG